MVKTSFSFFLPVKIWEQGIYKQKKFVKIKNRAHLEKKKIRMRKSEENKR